MKVRLPTAARYVAQVEKSIVGYRIRRRLCRAPFPLPLAAGAPSAEYPLPCSVYQWLRDDLVSTKDILELSEFAADLANFFLLDSR
jgi:hypothetical protein